MSYFLTQLRLSLARQLGSLRSILLLLLLPALALAAVTLTPGDDAAAPVTVGVVTGGADEMWRLLEARSDSVLTFVQTDGETLERNIAAGRWDCGVVLAEDFEQRAKALDTDRIMTLRIGPGSAVYPLVKETLSACMAQLIGPDIAKDYLLDSGILTEVTDEALLGQALSGEQRVNVQLTTADSKPLDAPRLTRNGTKAALRWLICVSILVRVLYGAADLAKWIASPAMKRTKPLRSPLCALAARAAGEGMLLILSGAAAMVILGEGLWGCAAVLGYTVFWLAVSLLLAQFPSLTTALHLGIPFAVVVSLLLSSVLMDISMLLPMAAEASSWLPVGLYLAICEADGKAFGILTGAAAIFAALSCLTARLKYR